MSDTLERVRSVTADLLKVDLARIGADSRFVEDLGAKSIQSVELVASFEEAFDVEINDQEAFKIKTVGDAARFIDQLLEQ